MNYGASVTLQAPFADAVARVREALAAQGFGVLTEIDVAATMRARLGEQMEDYVILGACNPPFAHQALGIDRSIGLLLPCNIVVRAAAEGTVVEALDRAGFKIIASGLQQCGLDGNGNGDADRAQLERLFLSLA